MKNKIEDKKQETKKINLEPIKIGELDLKIKGTTPLLMEKMSDKTAEELTSIMQGMGRDKKKNRDFAEEVKDKIHYCDNGKVGFPAAGFKKALVQSAPYMDGMDMKLAKSIVVLGDMIEISSKPYVINKTMGRDSGRNRAPRPIWRPEFREWSCTLKIRYNSSLITPEQIVGLVKLSGFHVGVGGWTPQHSGNFGMYTVA